MPYEEVVPRRDWKQDETLSILELYVKSLWLILELDVKSILELWSILELDVKLILELDGKTEDLD